MAELIETRAGHARGDIREDVRQYRSFHDNGGGSADSRKGRYTDMVRGYYDLVTDIYEQGWGESFHFAPRYRGESFDVWLTTRSIIGRRPRPRISSSTSRSGDRSYGSTPGGRKSGFSR
jgi:hypothetical protein